MLAYRWMSCSGTLTPWRTPTARPWRQPSASFQKAPEPYVDALVRLVRSNGHRGQYVSREATKGLVLFCYFLPKWRFWSRGSSVALYELALHLPLGASHPPWEHATIQFQRVYISQLLPCIAWFLSVIYYHHFLLNFITVFDILFMLFPIFWQLGIAITVLLQIFCSINYHQNRANWYDFDLLLSDISNHCHLPIL